MGAGAGVAIPVQAAARAFLFRVGGEALNLSRLRLLHWGDTGRALSDLTSDPSTEGQLWANQLIRGCGTAHLQSVSELS